MEDQCRATTAHPTKHLSCEDLIGHTTEERAVTILDGLLADATVVVTDIGRGGHDLELRFADGRREAVEVTEATSERMQGAQAAYRKWLPEAYFVAPRLSHDWHVYATVWARFDVLAAHVPPLLHQLEQFSLEKFFFNSDALRHPPVADLYRLGIEAGFRWNQKPIAKVVVSQPGDRTIWKEPAADPGQYLLDAIETEAAKPDNVEKLAASGCDRGHIFIWVDSGLYPPWKDLAVGRLPIRPPELPAAIDVVWVATCVPGDEVVVWSVDPPDPWQRCR